LNNDNLNKLVNNENPITIDNNLNKSLNLIDKNIHNNKNIKNLISIKKHLVNLDLDEFDNTSGKSIQLYIQDGTKEILNNLNKPNDTCDPLFFKDAKIYN
jgi:hypothetical protein